MTDDVPGVRRLAEATPGPGAFPVLRWFALAWLAAWAVAYARGWGLANFLHLCDLAVILACLGLWRGSPLILSSQAVSSLVVDVAWDLDLSWRLATGRHLIGGTEYMFDDRFPLALRVLSLFHVALPMLLVWALRRIGYDTRALALQSAIAVAVLCLSRVVRPDANINFAHQDPFLRRSWGPAPLHLAVILLPLVGLLYWPTHRALRALLPAPRRAFRTPPGA